MTLVTSRGCIAPCCGDADSTSPQQPRFGSAGLFPVADLFQHPIEAGANDSRIWVGGPEGRLEKAQRSLQLRPRLLDLAQDVEQAPKMGAEPGYVRVVGPVGGLIGGQRPFQLLPRATEVTEIP